jgi:hypothetical protein
MTDVTVNEGGPVEDGAPTCEGRYFPHAELGKRSDRHKAGGPPLEAAKRKCGCPRRLT